MDIEGFEYDVFSSLARDYYTSFGVGGSDEDNGESMVGRQLVA